MNRISVTLPTLMAAASLGVAPAPAAASASARMCGNEPSKIVKCV
jgi:hypothetical protein